MTKQELRSSRVSRRLQGLPDSHSYLAPRTEKIGRLLAGRLPHLEFAFWDLSEFMPAFHNVRRNMVFVECEKLAVKEVIATLASDSFTKNCLVYSGERKPKAVNEEWASAKSISEIRDVVVVLARKDFGETAPFERNDYARVPSLERRLVDLLYYSLKGFLPIALDEAVNAFEWGLNARGVSVTRMQRYAARRYFGWFFSVLLYSLVENKRVNASLVDPRYLESGKRYYDAVLRVNKV